MKISTDLCAAPSTLFGAFTGLAYAPLLATRMICGRFARPAAFFGACWAATQGVLRLIALRGMGPRALLAQLKEAALNIGGSCISAAEKVCSRFQCCLAQCTKALGSRLLLL